MSEPPLLGKHIAFASRLFAEHGWDHTVRALRTPQDIPADIASIPHPAGRLLNYFRRQGTPVKVTTPHWTQARKEQAIRRGPHKSAHEHSEFLAEEMSTMCERGQWMVLPYDLVKHIPNLRISPLGVVPQHDRRPRTIVDYSYYGINDDTIPLSPDESMQFGRALDRVLHTIVHADPRHGPVHMIKVDIADGFYRLWTAPQDIPTLGVAFPSGPDGVPLVAFPLTVPMGWLSAPPNFCVLTETVTDLANAPELPFPVDHPHRLEALADTPPAPESEAPVQAPVATKAAAAIAIPVHPQGPRKKPVASYDVYMDDFLGLGQGRSRKLHAIRRRLFHCIDRVLRPLSPDDPATRQEPISTKKLSKGDAAWATRKVMLGWLVDSAAGTIELPPRRLERLRNILDSLPRAKKRIATKKWHQVLGELRSMARAIPGLRGLFSLMQEALRHDDRARIPLSSELHDFLDDLRTLAASLAERPTRLREIVPTAPYVVGASDAAVSGMGGIAFLPLTSGGHQPVLWRSAFAPHTQASLVSFANPSGTISNSDLELAGTIAHNDIVAQAVDTRERTVYTLSDNTPAAAWQSKGSTTTTGPAAYLLRLQALHQRQLRYLSRVTHIPGVANCMADDCSRQTLANATLEAADAFRADLRTAQETARTAIVAAGVRSSDRTWDIWTQFCLSLDVDPMLRDVAEPTALLQVFAVRTRDGRLSKSGRPVGAGTVATSLRDVGQTFSLLGAPDPRLDTHGRLDIRLTRLNKAFVKADPPPDRVKPIPLSLLIQAAALAYAVPGSSLALRAIVDMMCLAFYFLMRPGEYCTTPQQPHPFRMADVILYAGSHQISLATATDAQLLAATSVELTFSTQKNAVRGEKIAHGRSGHPFFCPVLAAARRVIHLRMNQARPGTPLHFFRADTSAPWRFVRADDITTHVRRVVATSGAPFGLQAHHVTAKSLRASGAMALLIARVDTDLIQLIGRWKSDTMLRYLHVQALPVMRNHAATMLQGDYTFRAAAL